MCGRLPYGNREILALSIGANGSGSEGLGRTAVAYDTRKSDTTVVPEKGANNGVDERSNNAMAEL